MVVQNEDAVVLPDFPEGSPEREAAHINLRRIRRVLTRCDLSRSSCSWHGRGGRPKLLHEDGNCASLAVRGSRFRLARFR
jgi:hypothetical protein